MSHSRITALRAQRLLGRLAYAVVPALTAATMSAVFLSDLGDGLIVFATVLGSAIALERDRYPLHLMPLASAVLRAGAPVIGLALALAVFALAGAPRRALDLAIPLGGAWVIILLGSFVKGRFDSARRIRIAVIGWPSLAIGLNEELTLDHIDSHQVVGWIDGSDAAAKPPAKGPRRLGCFDQVRQITIDHQIDFLVHAVGPRDHTEPHLSRLDVFEGVADSCLDLPVRLIEAGQLYEDLLGHVPLGQSNAAWFQYLLHPRYRAGSQTSKRAFDLVVGGLMLAVMSPFLIGFAIAIKLTDGGPVFYRQRRMGERGRPFSMYKLRSMRTAAEDEAGPRWSQADDDRVTGVGRVMRRLHIDELPQLWNILRGEMTIVGPRPERPELIADLEERFAYYDRRHLVKPGLAGWAQARCGYGGSDEGTSWKLCHDLFYLKHRSLYFDTLILIENIRVSLGLSVQFGARAPQEQFILGEAGQLR